MTASFFRDLPKSLFLEISVSEAGGTLVYPMSKWASLRQNLGYTHFSSYDSFNISAYDPFNNSQTLEDFLRLLNEKLSLYANTAVITLSGLTKVVAIKYSLEGEYAYLDLFDEYFYKKIKTISELTKLIATSFQNQFVFSIEVLSRNENLKFTESLAALTNHSIQLNDTIKNDLFVMACRKGDSNLISQLLDKDPQLIQSAFATIAALEAGHTEIFTLLIRHQDNSRNDNYFFHKAVRKGSIEMVRVLLRKGVDVNALNYENKSALWNACEYGQIELAKLLVSYGADVTFSSGKDSLLSLAFYCKLPELGTLFMQKGRQIDAKILYNDSALFSKEERTLANEHLAKRDLYVKK